MNLIPLITTAGLNAVINATNDGLQTKIVSIALGDAAWTPDQSSTELSNERARVPITGSTRVSPTQIHVTAIEDGDIEYWVREIGFYLDDGTLLAIWSQPDVDRPLAYKAAAIDLLLGFDLVLSALPVDSIIIEDTGGLNLGPGTQEVAGVVRFSTEDEALQGDRDDLSISPATLKAVGDENYKTTFATEEEALAGDRNDLSISPIALKAVSDTNYKTKFATDEEALDRTRDDIAMSPATTVALYEEKYEQRLEFGPIQLSGFLNDVNESIDFVTPFGYVVVGLIRIVDPSTQNSRWRVRYQQVTISNKKDAVG